MEKQSERKNNRSKAVIIVIAMLLMVALVVGMGAMTYSRYITSGTTGSQTATAAKWGFVVTVNANDLLGENYTKASGDLATVVTENGVAVKSSTTSKVVAPGTTGSMTISVDGTAEVLSQLSISVAEGATDISCGNYHPIVWTLKKAGTTVFEKVSMADLATALTGANEKVESGDSYASTYTLSWEWSLTDSTANKDAMDTAIGFKAQGKSFNDTTTGANDGISKYISGVSEADYNSISTSFKFDITVSVEQIQA